MTPVPGRDPERTPAALDGWESLARKAAARRDEAGDGLDHRFLLLSVEDSLYAVPVDRVREIVRTRSLTPIPGVSSLLRGVISLRGEMVEVLDLRRCLRPSAAASDGACPRAPSAEGKCAETGATGAARVSKSKAGRARIVILHTEGEDKTGLQVDRVLDVWRVSDQAFRPPVAGMPEAVTALCLRADGFVSVIDIDRILESVRDG